MSEKLTHPLEKMDLKNFDEIAEVYGDLYSKVTKALENNEQTIKLEYNNKVFEANVYDPAFTLGWLYGMATWYKSGTTVEPI